MLTISLTKSVAVVLFMKIFMSEDVCVKRLEEAKKKEAAVMLRFFVRKNKEKIAYSVRSQIGKNEKVEKASFEAPMEVGPNSIEEASIEVRIMSLIDLIILTLKKLLRYEVRERNVSFCVMISGVMLLIRLTLVSR